MSAPRRLPCDGLPADGGEVVLDAAAAHHARVLRLDPGAPVVLFDGRGGEAEGTLLSLDAEGARCRVGPRRERGLVGPRVVLCPGLPKGGKLDAVVRATTELGVAEVHPFLAARSVSRPDARRAAARRERLEAVAREAARQSGRADRPAIEPPAALGEVLGRAPEGAARIAFVPGAARSLAEALAPDREEAWLVIGPEGGLDEAERSALAAAGFLEVGLGGTVLRAETAGVVVVALALDRLGALRPPRSAR